MGPILPLVQRPPGTNEVNVHNGALKTLNVPELSEFKTLKVLDFPKLALKRLELVHVNLSSSMHIFIT